ncbi:carbohydrate ABC transporter permease [Paenibacillus luteus]|uniref:carbohydrate ABC transporter permease n=1 Tax=Paenibacillus luteus TaxID=2545753 RepID=UPI0011449955|nr:sugar ABC transporter permease [Paenibacillus luteus]
MLQRYYYSHMLLVPGLILFGVFFIVPSLAAFYFAFTNMDAAFQVTRWVGFDNFRILFEDDDAILAFKNTFIFAAITTVFKVLLGFFLAIFANQKLKSVLFLRSVIFFPAILSTVGVATAFVSFMHPSNGLLNGFLELVHLDALKRSWLTDPSIVIYSISLVEIWKWTGFSMMLFLAALQTISQDVIESARIDGASSWRMIKDITVPMIMPVLNTTVILNLIGGLKVFDIVYALTGGGPGSASSVLNTLVYRAFSNGRNGEATAANLLLFVIVLVVVLLVNRILNRPTER